MLDKVKHINNRFIIAILIFIVWIVFIDDNSLIYLHGLNKEINDLEQKKDYYQEGIRQEKQELKDLENPEKLQKYAREKLLMKKDGEDIYIVEDKE